MNNIILNGDKVDTIELEQEAQELVNNIKGMSEEQVKEYFEENEIKVINHIAKRAVKLKMGARGLRQIVVDMFSNIYSEILLKDIKLNEKYECIITEDTVYNNKKFKLCKKEVKI